MLKHDCTKASVKSSTEGLGVQDLLSQRGPRHTFISAVRLKAKWLLLLFLLWFSKPSTGLAPINWKLNLWNKWDCETSVKWSSNHDKCGSVRLSSGGEIPPSYQTAGLTVHPSYKANRMSLWWPLQSPRKMLWLFCVNITVALRGKDIVNFEICLDFWYFTSNDITVPKKGSNFSSPAKI